MSNMSIVFGLHFFDLLSKIGCALGLQTKNAFLFGTPLGLHYFDLRPKIGCASGLQTKMLFCLALRSACTIFVGELASVLRTNQF